MSKTYTHLTYDLRCQIYALKQSGKLQCAIAYQLGIYQSTISRELARNAGWRGYRYKQAHSKATLRRHRASVVARMMTA
jgi:transposase, IS30 family